MLLTKQKPKVDRVDATIESFFTSVQITQRLKFGELQVLK
jgi:hypothetical protein